MRKKSEVIKYKIMLTGDEKIFNGKKFVNGTIVSGNASSNQIYISYKYRNKENEVLICGCCVEYFHTKIFIHGFVREKGEQKFSYVHMECIPIK